MPVVATKPRTSPAKAGALSNKERLELYSFMRLTRECDEAILRLYRQGKIVGGAYTGRGNEATAVGSAYALEDRDYLLPMHRDLGAHFVKGQSVRNIMLQQLGRAEGMTRGRDGTLHYADPSLRIYGNVSHLGAMVPMAAGFALAAKLRKDNAVVLTYIGDGGSNVGEVHEGMNLAAVLKLPLILIIENNQFAYSTPTEKQFLAQHLSDRAVGLGIPGTTVDGTNVVLVYETTRKAIERARSGEGPSIIETITMRMQGHSAADDASYVPAGMIEEWKKKDPIDRFERILAADRVLVDGVKEQLGEAIAAEVEEAVRYAVEAASPDGREAGTGVFAPEKGGGAR